MTPADALRILAEFIVDNGPAEPPLEAIEALHCLGALVEITMYIDEKDNP